MSNSYVVLYAASCDLWSVGPRCPCVVSGGRPAAMQNSLLAGCYHIDNTYLDLESSFERP